MTDSADTRARRAAIVELIRTRHVATQAELRELLSARGYDVTQATLSRDLAKLHARRASRPDGGTAYE
nr:arginine repressor [Deltaproteobacteria bacterium]